MLATIEQQGTFSQLNESLPTWGALGQVLGGSTIGINLWGALKRNQSDLQAVSGLVQLTIDPDYLSDTFEELITDGVLGVYVADANGGLYASSFENTTEKDPATNYTTVLPVFAFNSSVSIVSKTFENIPNDLEAGQTKISVIGDYVVATTRLVSEYGLEAFIVTVGDYKYFEHDYRVALTASAISFAAAFLFAALGVGLVSLAFWLGLKNIRNSLRWLQDDQADGTNLLLRNEDGEYDCNAISHASGSGYSLQVWFREMDEIGTVLDDLALNNRELKMFFPSIFVGMTKEEFRSGAHKTNLRMKNVSVMFVDIVRLFKFSLLLFTIPRFSSLCTNSDLDLQSILQIFLGTLESPVFKKKGLTKRLGDGFMAAFGFCSGDDDIADLCSRAFSCARLIARNLPKVNRALLQRMPHFPATGLKVRIGVSAGQANIGVVHTESMSNADVYGDVVNLAQRLEDSGRYKCFTSEGAPILFTLEEIPKFYHH